MSLKSYLQNVDGKDALIPFQKIMRLKQQNQMATQ